jgi:broad specificity phosphatase PhoE
MILIRHGQSEFNAVFGKTRRDPGITDPALTEEGRRQAADVAETLRHQGVRRLIASPYTRALQTAEIIAASLELPVTVEVAVGERAAFMCDIGTHRSELIRRWPRWQFDHIDEQWWPALEEPEHAVLARAQGFRLTMAGTADWRHVAVVSHWGFIRALTGVELGNCQTIRADLAATGGDSPD